MIYTYTFKDGTTRDYTYKQIIDNANNFKNIGSGSLDAVTKSGLEAIANGGGEYSTEAKELLNFWNNPTSVENNYADVTIKNAYSAGNTDGQVKVLETELDVLEKAGYGNGNVAYDKVREAYDKTINPSETPSEIPSEPINYDKDGKIAAAYQAELDAIERTRQYTEELVAQAKEEAIRNAYTQYGKGRATYGQKAEQLAQMRLSNSGYGDYLEGVAYGSMVGGVQDANKTADEAIRNAYYNAEQSKAQATAKYNERLSEAEKAYTDKLVSVLGAVGSGEIDSETAKTIAKAYGLNETDIAKITSAAEKTEKATIDTHKSQITADTDNATIDAITDLDDKAKSDLKAYKDDLKADQKIAQIESEEAGMGDITDFDKLKEKGEISTPAYQKAYFAKALSWIEGVDKPEEIEEGIAELDRLLHWEKISQKDYDNLKQYLYRKVVTEVDNRRFSVDISENTATVKLGGEKYDVQLMKASGKAKKFLDNIDAEDKTIIEYNKALYLYADGQWNVMGDISVYEYDQRENSSTSSNYKGVIELKAALNSEVEAGYSANITTPTHQQ